MEYLFDLCSVRVSRLSPQRRFADEMCSESGQWDNFTIVEFQLSRDKRVI